MSNALDELSLSEMDRLHTLGMIAIISNGHLLGVVDEDCAERFEEERIEREQIRNI